MVQVAKVANEVYIIVIDIYWIFLQVTSTVLYPALDNLD